jgi:plasmid stabilization system protein ParE
VLAENIAEIAGYIERERQSRAADSFVDKLTDYCDHIARLPGRATNPYSNGLQPLQFTISSSFDAQPMLSAPRNWK